MQVNTRYLADKNRPITSINFWLNARLAAKMVWSIGAKQEKAQSMRSAVPSGCVLQWQTGSAPIHHQVVLHAERAEHLVCADSSNVAVHVGLYPAIEHHVTVIDDDANRRFGISAVTSQD